MFVLTYSKPIPNYR